MDEILHYTVLFDIYGELLTEKQQQYFKDYYFHNLSLSEIAQNYQVSRNAIHKQIKESLSKLEQYEQVLHLAQKNDQLDQLLTKIIDPTIKQELIHIIENE